MSAKRLAIATLFALSCSEESGPSPRIDGDEAPALLREAPQVGDTTGKSVVRSRTVEVDAGSLHDSRRFRLSLFDGRSVVLEQRRIEPHDDGSFSWIGSVEGADDSLVVLVSHEGRVTGRVFLGRAQYQLRPSGEGRHVLSEIVGDLLPDSAPPRNPPAPPVSSEDAPSAPTSSDDGSLIDLLVLYTDDAEAASSDIVAEVHEAVDVTNEILANSAAFPRMRLVHTARVEYAETGDAGIDLDRISDPSDGFLDMAHPVRNEHCADLVSLIIEDDPDRCGIGYLMSPEGAYFESWAFSVVRRDCATGNLSMAHELGHNMGAGHDRYADPDCGLDNGDPPYSCGFVRPGEWRTVMAYRSQCDDLGTECPRIPHFSNPDVSYGGTATGVPAGQPDAADNARTLTETSDTVANFRTAPDDDGDGYTACHDCDDTNDNVHPDAPEDCDGLDNDCDADVDNGGSNACGGSCSLANAPGAACDGPDGDLCADDVYRCSGLNAAVCPVGPENGDPCDGMDNDCDGNVDNGGSNACGGSCSLANAPVAACDGPDDDVCADDSYECAGFNATACSAGPDNGDACDALDNDCDGTVDNEGSNACGGSCALADLPGDPCDGPDADLCVDDVYECSGLNATLCPAGTDAAEACDGLDNDCNGSVDDAPGSCSPGPDGGSGEDGASPDAAVATADGQSLGADLQPTTNFYDCDCSVGATGGTRSAAFCLLLGSLPLIGRRRARGRARGASRRRYAL